MQYLLKMNNIALFKKGTEPQKIKNPADFNCLTVSGKSYQQTVFLEFLESHASVGNTFFSIDLTEISAKNKCFAVD